MTKIIIDSAIPYIRDRFPEDIETIYVPGKEITPEIVKDADAIIVRTRTKCDKELLEGSKVKLVATATIGTDHIDVEWCENNGITVKNAPGCNAPGVAQYVFSSIFKSRFQSGNQTLGIIGFGNVGHVVWDWAQQMGIKTLICDPPRKKEGLYDVEYHDLEYVLRNSDAVTLHVPFIKDGEYPTYYMIGKKELEMMRPDSILINSSRGGVVSEADLKPFLKEGRIKAVIDVWENEPVIDKELVELAKIKTPHIAGYSEEGKKRATRMVLEAVENNLGIKTQITRLECNLPSGIKISKELIEGSYNPLSDSDNLLADISGFEDLRNHYHYRHEPLFSYPPKPQ